MARDQRNYRERDREKHNAARQRPASAALAGDGVIHRTDGSAMPYTFCGKRVEHQDVAERLDYVAVGIEKEHEFRCPDCWDG